MVQDLSQQEQQEQTKEAIDAFLTRDSRNTFVARVYGILSLQLLVTMATVIFFGLNPNIPLWFVINPLGKIFYYASILGSILSIFVVTFNQNARRASPSKWIWLSVFTVCESLLVGSTTALMYSFRTVVAALVATATATASIGLYTHKQQNPRFDLTQWGVGLSSALFVFILFGLFARLGWLPWKEALMGGGGSVLFCFFLAYDMRLIVSGKNNKYRMNEKDYVFGAMALYVDIINLFLQLLRLISAVEDGK